MYVLAVCCRVTRYLIVCLPSTVIQAHTFTNKGYTFPNNDHENGLFLLIISYVLLSRPHKEYDRLVGVSSRYGVRFHANG